MKHVECMGQILGTASFGHGTAAQLHTNPASTVTSHDSHGTQDVMKDTVPMCSSLTATQYRSRYFINPGSFNLFITQM